MTTSLKGLNASNLATGTVPPARMGSGTTDATTFLRGDGSWQSTSAISGAPGGADTQIQFNDAGAFAGSPNFTWNNTTETLSINMGIATTPESAVAITGTFNNAAIDFAAPFLVDITTTAFGSNSVLFQVKKNGLNAFRVWASGGINVGDPSSPGIFGIQGWIGLNQGTMTVANHTQAALSITTTWNDASTNFYAPISLFVTNTASQLSNLMLLQVGSTPVFVVNVNGDVTATGNIKLTGTGEFIGSGAGLTNLNASDLATGTVPTAVLGFGTANTTTFLRGDNTWQVVSSNVTALATQMITWSLASGAPISVGTDKTTWEIIDWNCTLQKVNVVAKTPSAGAAIILDILYSTNNGTTFTSLWATNTGNRPTLAVGVNNVSISAFDTTTLNAGTLLRIDVIQVGSTTPGQGLTVQLEYSWQQMISSGPAGTDTQIQYNQAGTMAGNPNLTFNYATGIMNATGFAGDGSRLTNIHTNPAGADTDIQYNQSGTTSASPNFTFNYNTNTLSINLGTLTAATQMNRAFVVTGTFNDPAGTFTSPFLVNITNTASVLGYLFSLQTNSIRVFRVDTTGTTEVSGNLKVSGNISNEGTGKNLVMTANDVDPGPVLFLASSGAIVARGYTNQTDSFFVVQNGATANLMWVDPNETLNALNTIIHGNLVSVGPISNFGSGSTLQLDANNVDPGGQLFVTAGGLVATRGIAGQTGDLFVVQDSTAAWQMRVLPDGTTYLNNKLILNHGQLCAMGSGNNLNISANDTDPGAFLFLTNLGQVVTRGIAGQTSDFFTVQDSAANWLARVGSDGVFYTHVANIQGGYLAIQPGTVTTGNIQSINNTVTWNAPGVLMANWSTLVVDEASATNSNLMQFFVGPSTSNNTQVFAVDKTGTIVTGKLPVAGLVATGTPSASTFLRGDGAWAAPSAGAGPVVIYADFAGFPTNGNASATALPAPASAGLGSRTIAAGSLNKLGKIIRLNARGVINGSTTNPVFGWTLYFGSTVVYNSNISLITTSSWSSPVQMTADLVVTATGTSGVIKSMGTFLMNSVTTGNFSLVRTNSQSPVTLDLTAAYLFDFFSFLSIVGTNFVMEYICLETVG